MQKQLPTPKRVAVYSRMAIPDQPGSHTELLKQSYIEQIGGIPGGTLADFYIDVGSGINRDRPELNRMLADCRAGKIDHVITKSVSRLSRNIADTLALCNEVKDCGVTIRFEKEGLVV
jgi:DNA invertase Pin-like site-specific DNA recombinase